MHLGVGEGGGGIQPFSLLVLEEYMWQLMHEINGSFFWSAIQQQLRRL